MKGEERDNDIAGDSQTNAAAQVPEEQHDSPSHSIAIDESGTASTQNELVHHVGTEAKNTFSHRWIQRYLVGDNSTLEHDLESYNEWLKEAKQKIQKVPTILRRFKMCYEPMIVAIGPYHHHEEKLKQMEDLKIQFMREYVHQSGKSMKTLYENMENLLIEAKNYYVEDVATDFIDKEFEDMMFLDSCFVIQFICRCVYPDKSYIDIKNIDVAIIVGDIILLENQLPFKILIKLMSLSLEFAEDKGKEMIDKFIETIIIDSPVKEETRSRKSCFRFCHSNSRSEDTSKEQKEPTCTKEEGLNSKSKENILKKEKDPVHLLQLVQTKLVDDKEIEYGKVKNSSSQWCSFFSRPSYHWCFYRSVKELKSVEVYFARSKSCRLSDIKFNSKCLLWGKLRLPQITIQDITKSLLLNLVAFEACADTSSNYGVTSYIYFMDTLIDQAEDVKELRSKGIIVNLLGNDDQVAKIFNEIGENLILDGEVFLRVKDSLNAFYRSYPRFCLTECLYNHFRSPWAVIALFVAIVILGLTITQTVFSGIQL